MPIHNPLLSPAKALSIAREDGVTVVSLGPEYENLNDLELDELKGALLSAALQAEPPVVVLDLSHLKFFGSAFIEAMFRAWNQLKARPGGRMSLCGLTEYTREVVEITHLDRLWSVFGTREEAVRSMRTA